MATISQENLAKGIARLTEAQINEIFFILEIDYGYGDKLRQVSAALTDAYEQFGNDEAENKIMEVIMEVCPDLRNDWFDINQNNEVGQENLAKGIAKLAETQINQIFFGLDIDYHYAANETKLRQVSAALTDAYEQFGNDEAENEIMEAIKEVCPHLRKDWFDNNKNAGFSR
jgi:hypothetical protein